MLDVAGMAAFGSYLAIFYIYTYIMSGKNIRTKVVSIDWKIVGRRIRELRGFDMTQADLARRIGVLRGCLSTVEHGREKSARKSSRS